MAIEVLKDTRIDGDQHVTLKLDSATGIAWIEDRHHGLGVSVHANISATGNLAAMKRLHWGKNARTVTSHGWHYNIDIFITPNTLLEEVVADHCQCQACRERRKSSRQNA